MTGEDEMRALIVAAIDHYRRHTGSVVRVIANPCRRQVLGDGPICGVPLEYDVEAPEESLYLVPADV